MTARRTYRTTIFDIVFFLAALALFTLAIRSCGATSLTGTIKRNGQPFTGYVDVGLVYPATNGLAISLPGSDGHRPIFNGQFPAMTVEGNDTLLPRGTYYQLAFYDQTGGLISRGNYVITGATYDVGAAVPTPVTPSNINYLDLLGIRNFSAQNIAIGHSFTVGTTTYGTDGVTGTKRINDIRFAQGYLAGSTTCGIQEAINSLPSTGGLVNLQSGSCAITTGVTITKPIILQGLGGGGSPDGAAFSSPTLIVNSSAAPAITISGSVTGAALIGFAIQGNPGTTQPTVSVTGPVSALALSSLLVYKGGGTGIALGSGVSQATLSNVYAVANTQHGITVAGATNITLSSSGAQFNGADGLQVSGAATGTVTLRDSIFSSNGANGVEVAAGAVASALIIDRSTFTNNLASGALISDGAGHVISQSAFPFGIHQQHGLNLNLPANPNPYVVQATVSANFLAGNSVDDFAQSTATTNVLFFPQTISLLSSSPTVVYTIGNPAAMHYILATSTATDYHWTFTTCANSTGQPSRCTGTLSLPGAMPNAAYTLQCSANSGSEPSDQVITLHTLPLPITAGASISYAMVQVMQNGTLGGITVTGYCHAHHD